MGTMKADVEGTAEMLNALMNESSTKFTVRELFNIYQIENRYLSWSTKFRKEDEEFILRLWTKIVERD